MQKRGRISTAWQKRFFVLRANGVLEYFVDETAFQHSQAPAGSISVHGARVEGVADLDQTTDLKEETEADARERVGGKSGTGDARAGERGGPLVGGGGLNAQSIVGQGSAKSAVPEIKEKGDAGYEWCVIEKVNSSVALAILLLRIPQPAVTVGRLMRDRCGYPPASNLQLSI